MKEGKNLTLDKEVIEFLETKAREEDRSISYIANDIILKEMKKKK